MTFGTGKAASEAVKPDALKTAVVVMAAHQVHAIHEVYIDGEPVGHGALRGKPGPVYARLHEAYQRAKTLQSI